MTIMEIPRIRGIDKLRLYDDNRTVAEVWIDDASVASFVEEYPMLKQYANREIDDIEICAEGCLNENLVMEIWFN